MRNQLLFVGTILTAVSRLTLGGFLVQYASRTPSFVEQPTLTLLTERRAHDEETHVSDKSISRRQWLKLGGALVAIGSTATLLPPPASFATTQTQTPASSVSQPVLSSQKPELAPVNLTKVVAENTINVTATYKDAARRTSSFVSVDRKTFNKIRLRDYPSWWPDLLRLPPSLIREIPNSELLVASAVAGASVDLVRTALLYPFLTIKTRIQAIANRRKHIRYKRKRNWLKRRLQILVLTFRRQFEEGNLYAGVVPTLLASVPATGVYYGTRDVVKRILNKMVATPSRPDEIVIALIAAYVADVASLATRTPADALALRLQVVRGDEEYLEDRDEDELVGDWLADSFERLPAVILTDLPYLLWRIALNMLISHGDEDFFGYELISISTACALALLTTPFDVARTRILVDSDGDPSTGIDGGSRKGVIPTMRSIVDEGDGGVRNLYAGWFERTLYLGVGRAWIDPVIMLGFTGIRDTVLLEWFD